MPSKVRNIFKFKQFMKQEFNLRVSQNMAINIFIFLLGLKFALAYRNVFLISQQPLLNPVKNRSRWQQNRPIFINEIDRYRAARISIRISQPFGKTGKKSVAASVPVVAAKVGSCRGGIHQLRAGCGVCRKGLAALSGRLCRFSLPPRQG
jgi:hypothetical protein